MSERTGKNSFPYLQQHTLHRSTNKDHIPNSHQPIPSDRVDIAFNHQLLAARLAPLLLAWGRLPHKRPLRLQLRQQLFQSTGRADRQECRPEVRWALQEEALLTRRCGCQDVVARGGGWVLEEDKRVLIHGQGAHRALHEGLLGL